MITVNNRVLLFGEWRKDINITTVCASLQLFHVTGGAYDGVKPSDEILEYRDDNGWRKVGAMMMRRNYHAVSLVKYEDFMDKCD